MIPDRILRMALWTTAFANVVVGLVMAVPGSALGQAVALPSDVPALYALLAGWCVALFGLMYGWLARQEEILRPGVLLGALGKLGVGAVAVGLGLGGQIPPTLALLLAGDLAFAGLFFWWLLGTSPASA